MTDRLTGIEERLKEGTAYRPTPHRPVVNTAGDRHGVVDSSGCVVDMGSPAAARFYAAAPTDMAALLGAVKGLLYVADNKAADNEVGRWWASVIRGTIEKHLEGKP